MLFVVCVLETHLSLFLQVLRQYVRHESDTVNSLVLERCKYLLRCNLVVTHCVYLSVGMSEIGQERSR